MGVSITFFQGQIKEKLQPKGYPQNTHQHFKKTEKLHDKYSQPTGGRFPSRGGKKPKREAGEAEKEVGVGRAGRDYSHQQHHLLFESLEPLSPPLLPSFHLKRKCFL